MTRRCSHCSNNGHNSRTCPARSGGSVKLFGVRLTEGIAPMKKSASMGCLSTANSAGGGLRSPEPAHERASAGYLSDDPIHASCSSSSRSERKKGTPWTEEEHRMFLVGLKKLGKGDWRGIARNFVVSRTPTQVASHAQKYFIRQTNTTRRKRRSSLFDMVPEMPMDDIPAPEEQPHNLETFEIVPENQNQSQDKDLESKETAASTNLQTGPSEVNSYNTAPLLMPVVPAFYPAFLPVTFPFWPLAPPPKEDDVGETHEVLRPTPVVPKEPVNADEVVGLSKLSIGEGPSGRMEPSALSLKLQGAPASRPSAFHVNPSIASSEINQSKSNAIHAV